MLMVVAISITIIISVRRSGLCYFWRGRRACPGLGQRHDTRGTPVSDRRLSDVRSLFGKSHRPTAQDYCSVDRTRYHCQSCSRRSCQSRLVLETWALGPCNRHAHRFVAAAGPQVKVASVTSISKRGLHHLAEFPST